MLGFAVLVNEMSGRISTLISALSESDIVEVPVEAFTVTTLVKDDCTRVFVQVNVNTSATCIEAKARLQSGDKGSVTIILDRGMFPVLVMVIVKVAIPPAITV